MHTNVDKLLLSLLFVLCCNRGTAQDFPTDSTVLGISLSHSVEWDVKNGIILNYEGFLAPVSINGQVMSCAIGKGYQVSEYVNWDDRFGVSIS